MTERSHSSPAVSPRFSQRLPKGWFAERIEEALRLYDHFLPTGAAYVPMESSAPMRFSQRFVPFCRTAVEGGCSSLCRHFIAAGARQGHMIGEPYCAPCWAGLNTVVFPVAPEGALVGAIETGGFCYPEIREDTLRFVDENLAALPASTRRSLSPHRSDFTTIPTVDVRGYCDFVYGNLFSLGLNSTQDFRVRREKYLQQRRIAELLHHDRTVGAGPKHAMEELSAFAVALSYRDRNQTMSTLDSMLSRILLAAGSNLEKTKAHMLPIVSLLVQAQTIQSDVPDPDGGATRQINALREIRKQTTVEDSFFWLFDRVRACLDGDGALPTPPSDLARRTIAYLQARYAGRVTLRGASADLGASIASIQRAVRRETGESFHRALLAIRLEEARNLLLSSDRPVGEIADATGFFDSAHFSRVFKAETDMSPSTFRRQLHSAAAP